MPDRSTSSSNSRPSTTTLVWIFSRTWTDSVPEGVGLRPRLIHRGSSSHHMEPTLHRDRYVEADWYAKEVSRVFERQWFCVGREEEIPEPGRPPGVRRGG